MNKAVLTALIITIVIVLVFVIFLCTIIPREEERHFFPTLCPGPNPTTWTFHYYPRQRYLLKPRCHLRPKKMRFSLTISPSFSLNWSSQSTENTSTSDTTPADEPRPGQPSTDQPRHSHRYRHHLHHCPNSHSRICRGDPKTPTTTGTPSRKESPQEPISKPPLSPLTMSSPDSNDDNQRSTQIWHLLTQRPPPVPSQANDHDSEYLLQQILLESGGYPTKQYPGAQPETLLPDTWTYRPRHLGVAHTGCPGSRPMGRCCEC